MIMSIDLRSHEGHSKKERGARVARSRCGKVFRAPVVLVRSHTRGRQSDVVSADSLACGSGGGAVELISGDEVFADGHQKKTSTDCAWMACKHLYAL